MMVFAPWASLEAAGGQCHAGQPAMIQIVDGRVNPK